MNFGMRHILATVFLSYLTLTFGQIPLYEFRDFKKTVNVPAHINSERSAVIVHVPNVIGEFTQVGDWKKLASEAHSGLNTMGIDAILYLNHYDLSSNQFSLESYSELFIRRGIRYLIFISQTKKEYELIIAPFSQSSGMIESKSEVFYMSSNSLYDLLLNTGREIRRADHELKNLLIPETSSFISGISVVEKTALKNYPGILRRSTLAVERFSKMNSSPDHSEIVKQKITEYNIQVDSANSELERMIKKYPYKYVIIDPMRDEDLLRNRHQFVLRSLQGQAVTVREMLDYKINPSETDFVSVIPIMPDQTRAKPIPRNTLVHKFYVRQNISKNIHIGEWDADVTWQQALENMIGNLIQEHTVNK